MLAKWYLGDGIISWFWWSSLCFSVFTKFPIVSMYFVNNGWGGTQPTVLKIYLSSPEWISALCVTSILRGGWWASSSSSQCKSEGGGTWGQVGKLKFTCHLEPSWTKGKGELWFGTIKGRKAIYMEMEKQIRGKLMFAGPSLTKEHRQDFDQKGTARFLPV